MELAPVFVLDCQHAWDCIHPGAAEEELIDEAANQRLRWFENAPWVRYIILRAMPGRVDEFLASSSLLLVIRSRVTANDGRTRSSHRV